MEGSHLFVFALFTSEGAFVDSKSLTVPHGLEDFINPPECFTHDGEHYVIAAETLAIAKYDNGDAEPTATFYIYVTESEEVPSWLTDEERIRETLLPTLTGYTSLLDMTDVEGGMQ